MRSKQIEYRSPNNSQPPKSKAQGDDFGSLIDCAHTHKEEEAITSDAGDFSNGQSDGECSTVREDSICGWRASVSETRGEGVRGDTDSE